MEKKHDGKMSREAYLLAVRTKELEGAREQLAATEELARLQNAWIAALLRAALGDTPLKKEGGALLLPKEAIREALEGAIFAASDAGEAWRITLQGVSTAKEAPCD